MFCENKRYSSFFANGPINKIQGSYATVENFKTAWTYLTFQVTVLKFVKVIGPRLQENLRIFSFQKLLWLDSLFPSAPVRVVLVAR